MNSKKTLIAAAALSTALVVPLAHADSNPFTTTEITSAFNFNHHGGEGVCGEGKCGEGKKGGEEEGKGGEGKCGEGKCGEGKPGDKPAH